MLRIKTQRGLSLFIIAGLLLAGPALGADVMIYPAKGQGPQQMEKDKFECYNWGKQQTGFDPMAAPAATAPAPAVTAKPGRSAARGAVAGLAIGSLSGDAGKGAAIGAAAGGVAGGAKKRGQEQEQEKYAKDQAAVYEQNRSKYNRAYGACLEGRGYTVK